MLFVYISDIKQITEQSFYLSAAAHIRFGDVAKAAMLS